MKETLPNKQRFSLSLLRIHRNEIFEPLVWGPVIVTFLTFFSYGAVLTVIPDYSTFLGISNKGLFFTFYTASSMGIRLVAGKVSDKYGRIPVLKISALIMAGSMLIMAFSSNAAILLSSAILYGIATGLNSPAITAWTVDLSNPLYKGRALASMYIAMEAGIGLGAWLSALIYHNHAERLQLTFLVLAVITAMATLYLSFFQVPKNFEEQMERQKAKAA